MSTDKESIEWYNENAEEYTKHVRTTDDSVYHSYYEKPAMYELLPNLQNKKVLSLGCGSGEDSEYLRKKGAVQSVGIDISEKLIEIAKTSYPECEFSIMDMEKLDFSDESFDFIYSSLAIHYIKDWTSVFMEAYRVLKPNSFFLFSCGHPIRTAMETTKNDEKESVRQLGVIKNKTTDELSIIGNYLDRKSLSDTLGKVGTVTSWHKSISEIVQEARTAGFVIENFVEPKPLPEMEAISPRSYKKLSKIPEFMIFKLIKI